MKMAELYILFIFVFSHTTVWAEDEIDCSKYNHPAHQEEYRKCLRLKITKSAADAGVDCFDCIFEPDSTGTNNFVEALETIAQPLAFLAATYAASKYQNKTQKAWADAYQTGYAECTNRFNSYLDYSTSVGANPISKVDANSMMGSCNGNSYGSYAGYGGQMSNGVGSYGNPFQMSGFSAGFMTGYGGSNWPAANGSIETSGMTSAAMGVGSFATSTSAVYSAGVTAAFGF